MIPSAPLSLDRIMGLPDDPEQLDRILQQGGYKPPPPPPQEAPQIPQLSAVTKEPPKGSALGPVKVSSGASEPLFGEFRNQGPMPPEERTLDFAPSSPATPFIKPTNVGPAPSIGGGEMGAIPGGIQVPQMAPPVAPTRKESLAAGKAEYLRDRPTVDPRSPDYENQLRIQQRWDLQHPLGSDVSRMPGVGGKILHALGTIGGAIAPGIAENVPGSPIYLREQEQRETANINQEETQAREMAKEKSEEPLREATTRNLQAEAAAKEANTPEKRKEYLAGNPDLANTMTEFEKADWLTTGHFPQKEPIDKAVDLKQQYAASVVDDIKNGRDPSTNPKTQQLADAITSLQKESGKEVNAAEQVKREMLGAMKSGDTAKVKELGGQLEKLGDPDGTKELARALAMEATRQRISEKNASDAALTPAAQKILMETEPVLEQVDQILADLEPMKNDNTTKLTAARIAYSMGYTTKQGKLADDISKIELSRIVAGARVLKGGSRAYQALEKAMQHAPDPWVDSPKMMNGKLETIRQNLVDVIEDAKKYGVKNLPANVETNTARKPAGGTPTPRPGYKIQRNTKTGETREVPVNP